jgi:hypothetical protein
MELRRFNTAGIGVFQEFLDSFNGTTSMPWPESALTDPTYSESVAPTVIIERMPFATRFELAQHLHERFEAEGFRATNSETGMWAWIACYYFNEICPTSRGGIQQPGSAPRWIPRSSDWRRYYRHLVAGPYGIYRAHRDQPKRAMALLCQRPGRPGDLVEQMASRQQIVTNPVIMQLATDWFVDPATGQQRKNANSKGRGGPRRLIGVLDQFDVTWDLAAMATHDLRSRLPPEFGGNPP